MPAVAATSPYPAYKLARNEDVVWFDAPVKIGTRPDVAGQELVALGISRSVEPRTTEALIIDRKDAVGKSPVMIGRLLKFSPGFQIAFDQAALQQLAKDYDLVLG